jgi:hypothetical protein
VLVKTSVEVGPVALEETARAEVTPGRLVVVFAVNKVVDTADLPCRDDNVVVLLRPVVERALAALVTVELDALCVAVELDALCVAVELDALCVADVNLVDVVTARVDVDTALVEVVTLVVCA